MNDWQFISRIQELLISCDKGEISDEYTIRKMMKVNTKYLQSKFKEKRKDDN